MPNTRTARISLTGDGVVVVKIRHGVTQSLEDAQANLTAAIDATAGRRRPLLVDIRGSQPVDAAVRHHYSGTRVADHFSALALVIDSTPLGRMVGNVYFRVAHLDLPKQLFAHESEATKWLTPYTK